MGNQKIVLKTLIFAALLLVSFEAQAQILNIESFRIKTDTTGWAGYVGLNISLTKNTKQLTNIGSKAHVQYKSGKNLILLLSQYNLLSSGQTDLIDKMVLHLRYNYKLTPKIATEFFLQGQKNSISKIDFRGLAGSGLRFKLSNQKKFKYYLGSTAMFEYERTAFGDTERHWRWSNYFSFTVFPADNFSIVSTSYFQPVFTNFSDYRISSQNAIYFKMTTRLSFKTAFNYNYDSTPVMGVPKEQYNLSSGIVYNFK